MVRLRFTKEAKRGSGDALAGGAAARKVKRVLRAGSSRPQARKRTALALYVVLLVLPTLVLGALVWSQMVRDQAELLAGVPLQVRDAASRLTAAFSLRLESLLREENARGFEEYRHQYTPREAVGASIVFIESALVSQPAPEGVIGWFSYHLRDYQVEDFAVFHGSSELEERLHDRGDGLRPSVAQLISHDFNDGWFRRITRLSDLRTDYEPLPFVAVNASRERDVQCLMAAAPDIVALKEKSVLVRSYDFHLRFYREPDGTPRIVATRPVVIQGDDSFVGMADCFGELTNGETLMQGFFIDPTWLFGEVPLQAAAGVLDGSMDFIPAGMPLWESSIDQEVATIRPVDVLGFETYRDSERDFGSLQVAISTRELRSSFAAQTRRFMGVAAMLLAALGTGLVLLLRNVRRELEQAERTENFVAAVTHELRTPVSAIRLYGEMLRDGWAAGPEKQKDYYERIVAEAARLETMVERVLQKARLDSSEAEVGPADLNECLRPIVEELVPRDGLRRNDLALELAPDLPQVMVNLEALSSIVVNLVENARKYAPVPPSGPPGKRAMSEPILVRTSKARGGALLEVLDRGPGIPEDEKENVFDAFYRVGNEATRTSKGTGLGLHLVRTQAESMGGGAEVLDREGGGSVFRISFRTAPSLSRRADRSAT